MVSSGVGRGFDRYLANYFTNRGYVATKSAGSKGLADVIAIPPFPGASILLIQAKAGDTHRITPKEWNGLYKLAEANPCITALAAFRDVGGPPMFFELLDYMKPGTRTEKLPWQPWLLSGPRTLLDAVAAEAIGPAQGRATVAGAI